MCRVTYCSKDFTKCWNASLRWGEGWVARWLDCWRLAKQTTSEQACSECAKACDCLGVARSPRSTAGLFAASPAKAHSLAQTFKVWASECLRASGFTRSLP